MILECIVTPLDLDTIEQKPLSERPVVLYAGKLHSDFGVLRLAQAAAYLEDLCEIWLYGGHGDCDDQLQALSQQHKNLKLHGIVPLEEIHKIERNAAILVNPRPNEKEFTKYSFPSKTAEYLMMGVPVVMYRLDGIPHEYDTYLHYVEENTAESIARKVREVLSSDPSQRAERALAGRAFIIENKNHFQQAARLVEFIKNT
jgi:glycosyltransferase involved in cell wall biosynthesis